MELKTNKPDGAIDSQELLRRIPTAERLRRRIKDLVGSVEEIHLSEGLITPVILLDDMCSELDQLANPLRNLMKVYVSDIIELGNFCLAGGKIIFVDPPKPQKPTEAVDPGAPGPSGTLF